MISFLKTQNLLYVQYDNLMKWNTELNIRAQRQYETENLIL